MDTSATLEPIEPKPKTEAEQVAFWHDRVSIAKKSLESWSKESGAERFIEEYNGKFSIFFQGLRGSIPVPPINEVFAYVQSDLASTYNRDPWISVNAESGTVKGSKLWEIIVNYDWRKLKVKDEIESEIIDKDLTGFGWHKVGNAVESEGTGDRLRITRESLYSMRVNWCDVVYNISAKNPPKDCVWMAQRIVRPLDEVRAKYPSAQKLEGTENPEFSKDIYDNATYKDDIKVAVLWEIWDSITKQIYLIAEGVNERFLVPPKPWPVYLEGFPFLMYWDYAAPSKSRPMSAIAPWESQLLEKMVLLAQAVNHAKRWNRQMIVTTGSLSEDALDKYERGDDGAVITNTGTGDLDKNIKILDYGQLPTDFYLLMDRISSIINNVNGQPEFLRGGVTKTNTRTIGELQELKAGAKGRIDRKIDRLETHLENIARLMLAHRKANFDFPEVLKIMGEPPEEVIAALGANFDPVTKTVKISPEEIAGEYDVEIRAGSTLPLDKETKMSIMEIVMKALATIPPGSSSPLLNTLIVEMLDNFDIKSLKEAYKAQQQADAQQAKMQSQEAGAVEKKATSQATKNLAQAEKIHTDTDIHMAETIAELTSPNGAQNHLQNVP